MIQEVRRRTVLRHSASTACRYAVSGSISLSSSEFFSPFPHGTCSLSVAGEYLALDNGLPRFIQDYSCPALLRNVLTAFVDFIYGGITLFAPVSQQCSIINSGPLYCTPYNPLWDCSHKVWALPFSLTATRGISSISFPPGTKMFQFPGFALFRVTQLSRVSTFGDLRVEACLTAHRSLSQLYHVLHRLPTPRHPPHTLSSL